MIQPLAATVPSGQIRYLKLPHALVLIARGDWSRNEDQFSQILDTFGIDDRLMLEHEWTYTWDEDNDCDVWVIDTPKVGKHAVAG